MRFACAFLLSVGGWGVVCPVARAQNEAPPGVHPLAQIRQAYEARLLEIGLSEAETIQNLNQQYVRRLDDLIVHTRRQGLLDPLLVLQQQREAFEADPVVPEDPVPGSPPEFAALQAAYRNACAQARTDRQSRTTEMVRSYLSGLEQWMRHLTASDRIDEALAFRREMERVRPMVADGPAAAAARPGPAHGPVFAWPAVAGAHGGSGGRGAGAAAYPLKAEGRAELAGSMKFQGGRMHVVGAGKDLLAACRESNALSLLITFKPADLKQQGPARIVSFSTDAYSRNFTLGQERDRLILRLRTSASLGDSTEVDLAPLEAGREYRVAVRYRPGELRLHVNGGAVDTVPLQGDFSNWREHELVLGNEWKDARPWHGEVRRVAVYSLFLDESELR